MNNLIRKLLACSPVPRTLSSIYFHLYRNYYYLKKYYFHQHIKTCNSYEDYRQNSGISNYDWHCIIGGYNLNFLNKLYNLKKINAINKILKKTKGKRLIDIGCANGFFLKYASALNMSLYGVDISKTAISEAKSQTSTSLTVIDVSTQKLPFSDNFFDIIVSFDVIEHIKNTKHLFSEMFRVLKPNGYIFIQTPNGKQTFDHDPTHINLKTQDQWEKVFTKNKLSLISSYTYLLNLPTPYLFVQKIIYLYNWLTRKGIDQVIIIAQKQ